MSDHELDPNPQSNEPDPNEFDPTKPSIPIAFPIDSLEDLESRSYFNSFHYPFNRSTVVIESAALAERRRMLVCHDMEGGYRDDKWIQGGSNSDAYSIWHWNLIDVFVYFSHHLVTIPPPSWTNTAHRHGVKVLGTFITEGKEGREICNTLLLSKDSAQMYAERLTELAVALGFDGWLLNMEITLDSQQIPNLKEFVSHLTQSMHSKLPGSLVIWYDSVTVDGELSWQDQLNENNKPFFDICDGIFVNYTWKEDYPRISAAVAGERKHDVYMGIDVFGRNTYGGGGWDTNTALEVLKKDDVSAAIFAPGWVYETKQPPDFQTAQNRWWTLVKKSWEIVRSYPKQLPFYSNFDQGHGSHVSIDGVQISDASWNNISSQGFQPIIDETADSTSDSVQPYSDFNESYDEGRSIILKGILQGNHYTEIRLFHGELPLGDYSLQFTYSSKTKGDSKLDLSFEFISATNERKLVLVSSGKNQFSNDFSEVVETTQLKMPGSSPDWLIQMGTIPMNGHILTNINAVCHRSSPETGEPRLKSVTVGEGNMPAQDPSEYFAVLGNISLHSSKEQPGFPPYSSWLVEGHNVKWTPGSEGLKTLDIKIVWKLKDGGNMAFQNYNIYVMKVAKRDENSSGGSETVPEYLGVAHVEAFYVSNLAVPSSISNLKFIIQVCGVDGSRQILDDSPFLELDVQG